MSQIVRELRAQIGIARQLQQRIDDGDWVVTREEVDVVPYPSATELERRERLERMGAAGGGAGGGVGGVGRSSGEELSADVLDEMYDDDDDDE